MSRSRGVLVALVAVALVVVAGAAALALRGRWDDSANGSVRVGSLDDLRGTWDAVNAVGAPAGLVAPVVLVLDGDRLVVRTGCNTGSGTAGVEDSRLALEGGGLAVTEMACLDDGVTEQEAWVLEMLGARPRLDRSGPYLYLHWGEGERYWLGLERAPGAD